MRIGKWFFIGIFSLLAAGCPDSETTTPTEPAAPVAPAPTGPSAKVTFFVGTWLTDTPATGIPKLVIRLDDDKLFVHGYGDCTPTYCDWGEASTLTADAEDSSIVVTWTFSFKSTQITLTKVDSSHVHAAIYDDYTVADGRTDRNSVADFHRQ